MRRFVFGWYLSIPNRKEPTDCKNDKIRHTKLLSYARESYAIIVAKVGIRDADFFGKHYGWAIVAASFVCCRSHGDCIQHKQPVFGAD